MQELQREHRKNQSLQFPSNKVNKVVKRFLGMREEECIMEGEEETSCVKYPYNE